MHQRWFALLAAIFFMFPTCLARAENRDITLGLAYPDFSYAYPGWVEEQIYGTDNILLNQQIPSREMFVEPYDTPDEAIVEPESAPDAAMPSESAVAADDAEAAKKADVKKKRDLSEEGLTREIGLGTGFDFSVNDTSQIIAIPLIYRPNFGKWWRRLSFVFTLPIVHKIRRVEFVIGGVKVKERGSKWGVGDVSLGVNYLFRWRNLYILPGYVVKFPSGDQNAKDGDVTIPMGSGSFDHILSLGLGLHFRYWRLLATGAWRYNGDTTMDAIPGATISQGMNVFATFGPEFNPMIEDWWLGLSLSYFYAAAAEVDGNPAPTNLHVFNLLVYTYYAFADNFRFEVAGGYPFYAIFDADLKEHPKTGSWYVATGFKFLF
ncbi:MAG: hypothetical protein C4523_01810 [Myxococcales bacterium]|nr:MAG: hypothetical protein C4523_01810 [Myxococcales bacterium]